MQSDFGRQIGELMERGARPVSFEEVGERSVAAESAARPRARRRRMAIGGVAAGIAAAGCAAALLIATASPGAPAHPAVAARPGAAVHPGGSPSGGPVILTAAMVQRVAAASRSALASSGREQVTYQNRKNGVVDGHGNDVITFSGGNFNWVMDDLTPPSASLDLPASKDESTLRLVNGETYLQVRGASPKSPWMRTLKWHATEYFPAPKTALQLLSPQAKFQGLGWQVIGGVRLEHLRATQLKGLPGSLTFAGYRQPGEALSSLDLWVDASGVLHQMQLELKSSDSSTTMTVAFSQFGQPETIIAPAHWIQSGL
jgi:hypothetical protein